MNESKKFIPSSARTFPRPLNSSAMAKKKIAEPIGFMKSKNFCIKLSNPKLNSIR